MQNQAAVEAVRDAKIEAKSTARGGWTRAQLAEWGVPWPPPKGWKKRLITEGFPNRNVHEPPCAAGGSDAS